MKLLPNQSFIDLSIYEQILFEIFKREQVSEPSFEVAFVVYNTVVYFSLYRPQYNCPSSAVVKLIQGIFDQSRDLSFFILRRRIYTTETITPMIRGVVRVAAKRVKPIAAADHAVDLEKFKFVQIGQKFEDIFPVSSILLNPIFDLPKFYEDSKSAMSWAIKLSQAIHYGEKLHDQNRRIACLITDSRGFLLGASANQASLNKTMHAEVSTVQEIYRRLKIPLPHGCKIYVTLKPCQMCAGMIFQAALDPNSVEIYYYQNDEGPLAQQTVLEKQLRYLPEV